MRAIDYEEIYQINNEENPRASKISDNVYIIVYENEYYTKKKVRVHSITYRLPKPMNRDEFIDFCAKNNLITTNSKGIEVNFSRIDDYSWIYTSKTKMHL